MDVYCELPNGGYVKLHDKDLIQTLTLKGDVTSIEFPTVSPDPAIQSRYEAMRLTGQSHRMAELLATRKFPGVKTDSTFLSGHCNGNQFEAAPALGDHYKSLAEAEGFDTTGKVYLRGLASYPGDPRAWVSGRGDVERVCRERGWSCDGAVSVDAPRYAEPTPDIPIADDLIQNEAEYIAEETGRSIEDVRETLIPLRAGEIDTTELRVAPIPEGAIGPE